MVANAVPFLMVTLTGTGPGPVAFNGLAGAGTLVRYGNGPDVCGAVKLQFDAGRGTTMRLSQLQVTPAQLDAVFFTHLHNDHTEGFAEMAYLRWMFDGEGHRLDAVGSTDVVSPRGATLSFSKFVTHVADAFTHSGEVAQRHSELASRSAGGPADLINTVTFTPADEAQPVWCKGDVKVSAVRSTHVAGHVSYRVDTPAGSVVIGGDAGSDQVAPPRASSTSEQVEKLAKGADIIVHSAIHPVLAPDHGSGFFPHAYHRQSTASDLGAMAQRSGVKCLVLTHLMPAIGADRHGSFKIPGGPLKDSDYSREVRDGGFTGQIVVGTDLASVHLSANKSVESSFDRKERT